MNLVLGEQQDHSGLCPLFLIVYQDGRTKGETLKVMSTEFERNSRRWLWLAEVTFWNCGIMHQHYFMTIRNSGSYAGLMIVEYCVSEVKVFSGKVGRKLSAAFTSEHCANEILTNLLMLMSPVKQSFLSVLFHNLKFLFLFILQKSSLVFVPQWSASSGLRRHRTAKCCPSSGRRRKSRSVCELWSKPQPLPSINENLSR